MKASNKNSDLLQDFVGTLLTEFDSNEPTTKISEVKNNKPTLVKPLKSSPQLLPLNKKPLKKEPENKVLSEKLNRAQTLLKTMPVTKDVEEKPLKEVDLPEIITTEDFLKEPVIEDEIVILKEESAEEEVAVDVETEKKQLVSPLQNGIPEWGKGSFETLIFNIGELKLALPLVKLGGIHRLEPAPTPMPEKPPWYLGLIADELGSIAVIDTAKWIMPEQYEVAKSKGLDYEFFVLLDDTRWGLACSKVDNAITLSADDIRWNNKNSKRPWLAGMIVDEMCALLDVTTLVSMLEGGAPSTTLNGNSTHLN